MTKSPNVIGRILYTVNVVNVVIGVKKKMYMYFLIMMFKCIIFYEVDLAVIITIKADLKAL
jgi:hypothetical protein